jgi:signal recognition particle subunit SEC65
MNILCSDIEEYGQYDQLEMEHLENAFKSLGYEVSIHKVLKDDKIFPRLPDEMEFVVAFGLNERKMPVINGIVFSIQPSIISSKAPVDYRFQKENGMFLLKNVRNLPLNATIACYGLKSVAYTIRKLILDQWELVDATRA